VSRSDKLHGLMILVAAGILIGGAVYAPMEPTQWAYRSFWLGAGIVLFGVAMAIFLEATH